MASNSNRRDVPPPAVSGAERDVLLGFLDYVRQSVAAKIDGVPEPQVRTPGVPSGTNLLGLLNHLINVERFMFLGEEPTSWPGTFDANHRARGQSVKAAQHRCGGLSLT